MNPWILNLLLALVTTIVCSVAWFYTYETWVGLMAIISFLFLVSIVFERS